MLGIYYGVVLQGRRQYHNGISKPFAITFHHKLHLTVQQKKDLVVGVTMNVTYHVKSLT
jgi:hypothetical protein